MLILFFIRKCWICFYCYICIGDVSETVCSWNSWLF